MNKIVSVPKRMTSWKDAIWKEAMEVVNVSCCFLSGLTMDVSVLEITSLQKAIAAVNASADLSTEDFFKTLLMYRKPSQSWWVSTIRDPQFLVEAINKKSSHEPVTEETQQNIAEAILKGRLGDPMSPAVALALANNLDKFTDEKAQLIISKAIREGRFGELTIRQDVALAIVSKLVSNFDKSTAPEVQITLSRVITLCKFRDGISQDVALAIVSKLVSNFDESTAPEVQLTLSLVIPLCKFRDGIPQDVALAIAKNLEKFTDPEAQQNIALAMYSGLFGSTLHTLPQKEKDAIIFFLKKVSLSDAIKNYDKIVALIGESPEFKQSALKEVELRVVGKYDDVEKECAKYKAVKNLASGVANFKCDVDPNTLYNTFASIARNLAAVLSSPPEDIDTCFPGFQALIKVTQEFKELIDSLDAAINEKNALLSRDSAPDVLLSPDSATEDPMLAASRKITGIVQSIKAFDRKASE